jgi:hypothetical protein
MALQGQPWAAPTKTGTPLKASMPRQPACFCTAIRHQIRPDCKSLPRRRCAMPTGKESG